MAGIGVSVLSRVGISKSFWVDINEEGSRLFRVEVSTVFRAESSELVRVEVSKP
jgi:hypothetical protein